MGITVLILGSAVNVALLYEYSVGVEIFSGLRPTSPLLARIEYAGSLSIKQNLGSLFCLLQGSSGNKKPRLFCSVQIISGRFFFFLHPQIQVLVAWRHWRLCLASITWASFCPHCQVSTWQVKHSSQAFKSSEISSQTELLAYLIFLVIVF